MGNVGRPRIAPRSSTDDPKEEILDASARLFGTEGYTATSTRAIADAVGLRQASLFHHFPRKESILTELLDRTLTPTLELAQRLDKASLGPATTLWVVVKGDVTNLCRGPHNLGALQLLPETHAKQFSWFWKRRQRLIDYYSLQVRMGFEEGEFPAGGDQESAEFVFGLVESVITAPDRMRRSPTMPGNLADSALRLLGASPSRIARARRQGTAFEAQDAASGRRRPASVPV